MTKWAVSGLSLGGYAVVYAAGRLYAAESGTSESASGYIAQVDRQTLATLDDYYADRRYCWALLFTPSANKLYAGGYGTVKTSQVYQFELPELGKPMSGSPVQRLVAARVV
jgi:hypothetical protein